MTHRDAFHSLALLFNSRSACALVALVFGAAAGAIATVFAPGTPAAAQSAPQTCSARCPDGSMSERFNCSDASYIPVCQRRSPASASSGSGDSSADEPNIVRGTVYLFRELFDDSDRVEEAIARGRRANRAGVSAYEAGRYEEAVRFFTEATRARPDSENYRNNLAVARERFALEQAQTRQTAATQDAIAALSQDLSRQQGARSTGGLDFLASTASSSGTDTHVASVSTGAFYGAPTTPEQSQEYVLINQMRAHAAALGWSEEEQIRLERALLGLQEDTYEHTDRVVSILWRSITEHSTDAAVAASAASGQGPDLYQSGWQSGQYSDCVLFAVATASGTPYGVVSARAAELVRNAEWRTAAERANPLSVFSNRSGGLNGGETVMLAEAFGQARPVPFAQFASTVGSGHPVMVSLATTGDERRGKHQVVLTRTFQHEGETWFEFIDSQIRGTNQRSRVRAYELERLITEAGVTITPGDAVPMLRSN